MSNQKIYILLIRFYILVDDEMKKVYILSTFSQQTVQQVKVLDLVQVLVSPELSKLKHSVMNKTFFTFHQTKPYWLMDCKIITYQIDSSKFYKKFFSSGLKCLSCNEEKTLELRKN